MLFGRTGVTKLVLILQLTPLKTEHHHSFGSFQLLCTIYAISSAACLHVLKLFTQTNI